MTIYQKELLRQLLKLNCTAEFNEDTDMLHIFSDGNLLCIAGKKGDLCWDQDKLVTEKRKAAIKNMLYTAITHPTLNMPKNLLSPVRDLSIKTAYLHLYLSYCARVLESCSRS